MTLSVQSLASQRVLTRAMATLPLKHPNDQKLLDALSLYVGAISQKYLLQYRDTPERFFANAPEIQREMKDYINYMLEGVVRKGDE